MYLKRKVDAFLEEWKYNLIRPFIEKVDGLSFCQSSLLLRTWLKICSTSQLKCYIAAGDPLIGGQIFMKEGMQMANEELNTALYKKVFAEQEQYRDWLLSQPPDEILNHCYEYTVREDIVLALEEYDLSDKQCMALLKLPSPLADVFKDFEKRETDHMDNIRDTIECRANTIVRSDSLTLLHETR